MNEFIKVGMSPEARMDAVNGLAGLAGHEANNDDHTVAGTGSYIIFHYELVTVFEETEIERNRAYNVLHGLGGLRLGGSVYAFPVAADTTPLESARALWTRIQVNTENLLHEGDVLAVHYTGTDNRLGVLAQCVPTGRITLSDIPLRDEE